MGMLDRIEMALDQIDRHVAAYIATVALQKAYEETPGPQALDVRRGEDECTGTMRWQKI